VLTNAVLAVAVVLVACERSPDKRVAPRAVLSASNAEANSKVPTLPAPSEVAFGATSVQFFVPEGMVSSARPPFVLVLHGPDPSQRCEPRHLSMTVQAT